MDALREAQILRATAGRRPLHEDAMSDELRELLRIPAR